MDKRFDDIKKKVIKIVLSTLGMALLLVMGILAERVSDFTESRYLANSKEQMNIVVNAIHNFYSQVDEDINMMASHPLIKEGDYTLTSLKESAENKYIAHSKNGGREQEIFEMFAHYVATHPKTQYVYLATEEGGYMQWPEVEMPAFYNPTVRPWYQTGISGDGTIKQTAPYEDTTHGMIVSNVRSIKDDAGNVIGVVGIDVNQDAISKMLSEMQLGKTGYFMLLHENGYIMADGNASENTFKQVATLQIPELEEALQLESSNFVVPINHINYVIHTQRVEDTGWVIVSFITQHELRAITLDVLVTLAIVFSIMLVIGILLLLGQIKKVL